MAQKIGPIRERITTLHTNSDSGKGPEAYGAGIPITPQEKFVKSVYFSLDDSIGCELNRLRNKEGIIPTCKLGCYHCCAQYILTNIAEAQLLAQYVKREFSIKQIAYLRLRTLQWHKWEDINQGRHRPAKMAEQAALSDAHPYCPMLVNGECIIYPVRPVTCRTHFVYSNPQSCRPSYDPEYIATDPLALTSVVTVTNPLLQKIRDRIENAGMDFSHSIMLLPQWLAIKMGWDLAVSL